MNIEINNKLLFSLFMTGFLYACTLVMFVTFLIAYFSGEMKTLVYINWYGEAHVELVMLSFFVVAGLYPLLYHMKVLKRELQMLKPQSGE